MTRSSGVANELVVTLADGQRLFLPTPARQRALRLATLISRYNGTVAIHAIDRLRPPADLALENRVEGRAARI